MKRNIISLALVLVIIVLGWYMLLNKKDGATFTKEIILTPPALPN